MLSHRERHRTERIGWLRATVLGANDGIVSTASLVLGVAAAQATHNNVLVAGVAGLVAGAMSMAAGEYVSVHSQADTEQADLALERTELKLDSPGEHRELTAIYVARGLNPSLAKQVADQLMAHDAIGAHLGRRDSSRGESDSPRCRNFTGVSRAPRWIGCGRGWCAGYGRRNARHALGRTGDGSDRRGRSSLRNSVNVSGSNPRKSSTTTGNVLRLPVVHRPKKSIGDDLLMPHFSVDVRKSKSLVPGVTLFHKSNCYA